MHIRYARPEDADWVAPLLRPAEKREILRYGDGSLIESVRRSIMISRKAALLLDDEGEPLCLFGLYTELMGQSAMPWLVGTDRLDRHKRFFLRNSRKWIEKQRRRYRSLHGSVDAEYGAARRWLMWLGFHIHAPQRTGLGGAELCYFDMKGL